MVIMSLIYKSIHLTIIRLTVKLYPSYKSLTWVPILNSNPEPNLNFKNIQDLNYNYSVTQPQNHYQKLLP